MIKTLALIFVTGLTATAGRSQNHAGAANADSMMVAAAPEFNNVTGLHRKIFGENYRKEWSQPSTLPVIRISEIKGGLIPYQRGGGHQSRTLRLRDKSGREWVLRSVRKFPEVLLPPTLRESIAKEILVDAMSAQHPYSALVVPVLADAAGVPHAHPVIGYVVADKAFGTFDTAFVNTICLLEERDPIGESDNSAKMYKELADDNDNVIDEKAFLRARLLDLFIGDWDRHEDQWRWAPVKNGKGKTYIAVPRDRDQVFHVIDGIAPSFISLPWILPELHDFDGRIRKSNHFFTVGNTLNKRLLNQLPEDEWMKITTDFTNAMSDAVLEKSLRQLPKESYLARHDQLLRQLKDRRKNLPRKMAAYYRFLNKVTEIQTSDKNEFISLTDAAAKGLEVKAYKRNKLGEVRDLIYQRSFDPGVTRELRIYAHGGADSIYINNHSRIKVRLIGGGEGKVYNADASAKKVQVYETAHGARFTGNRSAMRLHLSDDSLNTAYVPDNPYNKLIPLIRIGFNLDDGFMLGAGFKYIRHGFRKLPYGSMQLFSFMHSFETNAFKFLYHGEWIKTLGNADLLLDGKALGPANTQNFFGLGNNTPFNKTGEYKKFYRVRFNLFQIDPALRWRWNQASLSIGPSLQLYHFNASENKGRFINYSSLLHTYDSTTIGVDKSFGGGIINFILDSRDNVLFPTAGHFINFRVQGYKGMNGSSHSFIQLIPEFSFYKKLDRRAVVVIAERLGGGVTAGHTTFYQSLFLGGHENLLGYRKYRFAGYHMLYNNLEARIRIANINGYILPGQLGLITFYDAGKVWAKGYNSNDIHQAVGAGLYFAPARMVLFEFIAGHSIEGWYPMLTMGFRF